MDKKLAVAVLGALAQDSRLDVFRLLVQTGPEGLAAGDIAARLRLAGPTLSFHLMQLKHVGLIQARREGRSLIYAANYEAMNGLMAFLTENCCGGNPAACAPAMCVPVTRVTRSPLPRRRQGGSRS